MSISRKQIIDYYMNNPDRWSAKIAAQKELIKIHDHVAEKVGERKPGFAADDLLPVLIKYLELNHYPTKKLSDETLNVNRELFSGAEEYALFSMVAAFSYVRDETKDTQKISSEELMGIDDSALKENPNDSVLEYNNIDQYLSEAEGSKITEFEKEANLLEIYNFQKNLSATDPLKEKIQTRDFFSLYNKLITYKKTCEKYLDHLNSQPDSDSAKTKIEAVNNLISKIGGPNVNFNKATMADLQKYAEDFKGNFLKEAQTEIYKHRADDTDNYFIRSIKKILTTLGLNKSTGQKMFKHISKELNKDIRSDSLDIEMEEQKDIKPPPSNN